MNSNNRVIIIGCFIHHKSIRRLLPLQNRCTKIPLCPFTAYTQKHIFFSQNTKKKIENLTNRKDLEKGYLRIGRFSFVSHDFAEIEEFWFVCVIFIREKKSAEVAANWENEELYKEEYRYFLLSKKSVFLFIFIL